MKLVDITFHIPEENIAADEVLLSKAEEGVLGETLRFWEAAEHFVVLGRSGKIQKECFVEACQEDGIKIIRRISGGGTVLQGPGCLNYSLVLSLERDGEYRKINDSYRNILGRIAYVLRSKGYDAELFPISDIAIGEKKISGNAQARKRKFFLHHGTLLFNFEIAKIYQYLKHPPKEPEYRRGRVHKKFVANIPTSFEDLREVIKEVFIRKNISSWKPDKVVLEEVKALAQGKYLSDKWNHAF